MKAIPQNVSESVRKRNPHLYQNSVDLMIARAKAGHPMIDEPKPRRIRQSTKPPLNKLEQEWFDNARHHMFHDSIVIPQSVKFKLANGVWFLPDFFVIIGGFDSQDITPRAIEIKGPQTLQDDAVVKLKVAAKAYPWISWSLEWKENGQWQKQTIYP